MDAEVARDEGDGCPVVCYRLFLFCGAIRHVDKGADTVPLVVIRPSCDTKYQSIRKRVFIRERKQLLLSVLREFANELIKISF